MPGGPSARAAPPDGRVASSLACMAASFNDELRLAHIMADDADSLGMSRFRAQDLRFTAKPDNTPVTEADTAIEESLRRTLSRARPRDGIVGEEFGATGESDRRWIIDPIDATKNYLRGVPVWATLIALEADGEIVASVVSAPALGRRWWASKGAGAFTGRSIMNATQMQVSKVAEVTDASLSYSSLDGWVDSSRGQGFVNLMRDCWRTRAFGDFWSYMLVAEGAVDIATEPDLALHDMAALDVIVREAGGRFTNLDGVDGVNGPGALATNGLLHEAVLDRYLGQR